MRLYRSGDQGLSWKKMSDAVAGGTTTNGNSVVYLNEKFII